MKPEQERENLRGMLPGLDDDALALRKQADHLEFFYKFTGPANNLRLAAKQLDEASDAIRGWLRRND